MVHLLGYLLGILLSVFNCCFVRSVLYPSQAKYEDIFAKLFSISSYFQLTELMLLPLPQVSGPGGFAQRSEVVVFHLFLCGNILACFLLITILNQFHFTHFFKSPAFAIIATD